MTRRPFHWLAAISLLLFLITIEQWIACPIQGQTWHFTADSGTPATQNNFDLTFSRRIEISMDHNHWTRWTIRQVTVPFAAVAVIFAVIPLFWLVKIRHPIRIGHCNVCGYDLRATPERCPECGAHVGQKPV